MSADDERPAASRCNLRPRPRASRMLPASENTPTVNNALPIESPSDPARDRRHRARRRCADVPDRGPERPRARRVLRAPRAHRSPRGRRRHAHPALRRLDHRQRLRLGHGAPPPAGALRRRRARLHPHREPLGVVLPQRRPSRLERRLDGEPPRGAAHARRGCTASAASRSRATAAGSPRSARRRAATSGATSRASTSTTWSSPAAATWSSPCAARRRALLHAREREGLARPLGANRPTASRSSRCARWAAARCASSASRSSATSPGVVYDALGAHAAMAVYWQRQDRGPLEGPARAARPGAHRLPVRHQRERSGEARSRRVRARPRRPDRRAMRASRRARRCSSSRRSIAPRSRNGQARHQAASSSISSPSSGASRSARRGVLEHVRGDGRRRARWPGG